MTTPSASLLVVGRASLPRFPIPRSTAVAEVRRSLALLENGRNAPAVSVRCGEGACGHRLYDVVLGLRPLDHPMVPDGSLRLERKCPACRAINDCWVTAEPGRPLAAERGFSGAWTCVCGRSLGHVDAVRGHVFVTCRCGRESRVVAADAIAVLYAQAGVPFDVSRPLM